MSKIKLEILGLSSSPSQSGSFALVLGEVGGTRRLPIIIGMFEAQAIAIEIEKITPTRPMTHDLFRSFGNSFNFHVEEIIISDLKEGVFFAQIFVSDGINRVTIDARPSDAIAIGLRFGASLYTTDQILNEAGITVSEEDAQESALETAETNEEEQELSFPKKAEPKSSKSKSSDLKSLSVEKLNEHLKDALDHEDYERAARIRDELNKRN
jgi:bifunctional DNase/RNase